MAEAVEAVQTSVRTYKESFAVIEVPKEIEETEKDGHGNKVKVKKTVTVRQGVPEDEYRKGKEKATKDNEEYPEALYFQSFVMNEANTPDGAHELAPNAVAFCARFNRGAILIQQQKRRELLEDPEFNGVEGDYDLREEVNAETERRKADPLGKAAKILGVSGDVLAAALALLQQQQSQQEQIAG